MTGVHLERIEILSQELLDLIAEYKKATDADAIFEVKKDLRIRMQQITDEIRLIQTDQVK